MSKEEGEKYVDVNDNRENEHNNKRRWVMMDVKEGTFLYFVADIYTLQ